MPIPDHHSASQPGTRTRTREAGFTLIEVIVAAMILAIVSGSAATAIISAMHASGQSQIRAQAQALAQRDQNNLRGMDVDQLANLDQTVSKTLNGTQFTIQETADYVSDASGTPSCSNPSADYLQTTSAVSWPGMQGPAIKATSLLTPSIGSVDPTRGTLAVLVADAAGPGISGVDVSVTEEGGGATASGQTAANGCMLFGDLPAGMYDIKVWPSTGSYIDGKTGDTVTSASPDVATGVQVSPGATASSSKQFTLDVPGSAAISFTDAFPLTVAPSTPPTATAPAVVLFDTNMANPQYRLCTAADPTCPAVGDGDTSFGRAAWQAPGGTVTATPLFPYTYTAYAGVCTADEPLLYGLPTDPTVTVTGGNTASLKLTLPAMVVRLYSGTNTLSPEIPVPLGASLSVTDLGCNMRYIGDTGSGASPSLTANESVVPLNTAYGRGASDVGLLTDPGMPYGHYSVCYTAPGGSVYQSASFDNEGTGEIVNLFAGLASAGATCA